jgi:hypothetical protein
MKGSSQRKQKQAPETQSQSLKRDRRKEEISEVEGKYEESITSTNGNKITSNTDKNVIVNNNNNNYKKNYKVVTKTRIVTQHKDTHSDSEDDNDDASNMFNYYMNCDLDDLYEPADAPDTGCKFDMDTAPDKFKKTFDALLNEVEEKKFKDSVTPNKYSSSSNQNQQPSRTPAPIITNNNKNKKGKKAEDDSGNKPRRHKKDKECPLLYHKHKNPPMTERDSVIIASRLASNNGIDDIDTALSSIEDSDTFVPITEMIYGFNSMENYINLMSMKPSFRSPRKLNKITRSIRDETLLKCDWIEHHELTTSPSTSMKYQHVIVLTFRLERFDVLYAKLVFSIQNEKGDISMLKKEKVFEEAGKMRHYIKYLFTDKKKDENSITVDDGRDTISVDDDNNNNQVSLFSSSYTKTKEEIQREKELEHKIELIDSIYLQYVTRYYVKCNCDDIASSEFIESIKAD